VKKNNSEFGSNSSDRLPDSEPHNDYRQILPQFEERTTFGSRITNPYSKLFDDRIIFLGSPIDDGTADDVMAQLLVLEAMDSEREITMYINSPGGSSVAMAAIYDTMQYIGPEIQTVCLGMAASAAAVLLAAGTKGKRLALPNSKVLIHQPAIGQVYRGSTSDLEIQANEMVKMREWLETTLAELTGHPIEKIQKDIERDKFLTAQEALEYGLIDQVLKSRKNQS
jgi:ATP-dependent Clp protease protease subunit